MYWDGICVDWTGWSRCNTLDLYSGGARFESRPGRSLSWLMLFVLSSNAGSNIGHGLFLADHFQFVHHPAIRRYIIESSHRESREINNKPKWNYCGEVFYFGNEFLAYFPYLKQEVLGRTNRLLSLIRHGWHWKRRVEQLFYCCVCIRYRGNVSTDPLPSNDRGIFTEPLPINDKGIHRHTHTRARAHTDSNVIS
jgi:hypothetical protein